MTNQLSLAKGVTKAKPEILTTELLKTFPGCENYSEEEAKEVVESIHKLVSVFVSVDMVKNMHSIDNQLDVYLDKEQQDPKVRDLSSSTTLKQKAA